MRDDADGTGTAGEIRRRRGIALSISGMERFLSARRGGGSGARNARDITLAECAARAKVGLRTLTRCLRGERVDRRSIELIFGGVGLELEPHDVSEAY